MSVFVTTPWRDVLHARLRERALPLIAMPTQLVPAATLWTGAREWIAWLRAHGVARGDRIVCALPPGPSFVMLLVAALWEELTFAPVPPDLARDALDDAAETLDARLVVARAELAAADADVALRTVRGAPTPDARFLLRTSGTSGAPRWIALSDANVHAVLDSHRPALALHQATVLSVLPWHHAFGLVIELLPSLLDGAEIVRDPSGGRDVSTLLSLAAEHPVTHLSAVPLTVRRLQARDDGRALLARLHGGVIGGAPVDAALADALSATRLRAGYGQTEASPGIALGAPGEWRAGTLGTPLGCTVRLDDDGVLAFRGPNACLGEWRDGALVRLDADRWVRTGDLATREADGTYTFAGRVADAFKLANGRYVPAAAIERAVQARFPAVHEAMLSTSDGDALVLAVSGTTLPSADDVRPLLGPLAARPLRIVPVAPDGWVRTAKGELDRRYPTGR